MTMRPLHFIGIVAFILFFQATGCAVKDPTPDVGEKIPSEDIAIPDFHSMGLLEGRVNIFRSASPTRDFVKSGKLNDEAIVNEAQTRMNRLKGLGIKTIVWLELPDPAAKKEDTPEEVAQKEKIFALEKEYAQKAGIEILSRPIANAAYSDHKSLEEMTSLEVKNLLDSVSGEILAKSKDGGVLFHCAAGHDRTGIVAAYIRMKYQHWPAVEAIAEMRRLGHNWPKNSRNDGKTSWHEDHLKAIEGMMEK
jgi:hypothetical protein